MPDVRCQLCSKAFTTPYGLTYHKRVLHQNSILLAQRNGPPSTISCQPDQTFHCPQCPYKHARPSAMQHHCRMDHPDLYIWKQSEAIITVNNKPTTLSKIPQHEINLKLLGLDLYYYPELSTLICWLCQVGIAIDVPINNKLLKFNIKVFNIQQHLQLTDHAYWRFSNQALDDKDGVIEAIVQGLPLLPYPEVITLLDLEYNQLPYVTPPEDIAFCHCCNYAGSRRSIQQHLSSIHPISPSAASNDLLSTGLWADFALRQLLFPAQRKRSLPNRYIRLQPSSATPFAFPFFSTQSTKSSVASVL